VLDDSFTPRPQLAKTWQPNDKADVWTFQLREGVKFQDGAPFGAKDVVYFYKRLLDPALASPVASSLSVIDPAGIEAVDDHTVRFKLKSEVVEFPSLIANRFTYILREGQAADQIRTQAIGTGPFKVQHFVPGEEPSVFVKNEHYWRPGLPKVDVVELRAVPDSAARIAAISSGQVDLVWDLPRIGIDGLEKNPEVKVVSVRSPFVLNLAVWTDTPPFDDVRVRQAMKYVIDREKIKKLVVGGRGQIGDDNPVAPWARYALEETPRKRDIAKAKALLAEAGHPKGLEVELFTSNVTPGFIELSTVLEGLLRGGDRLRPDSGRVRRKRAAARYRGRPISYHHHSHGYVVAATPPIRVRDRPGGKRMPPPVGLGVDRRRRTRQGTRGLARTLLRACPQPISWPCLHVLLRQRHQIAQDTADSKNDRRSKHDLEAHHGFAPHRSGEAVYQPQATTAE
jgi:hypothetical protein